MNTIQTKFLLSFTLSKRSGNFHKLAACFGAALISLTTIAQEFKVYSGVNMVMDSTVFFVVNNTAFKNDGSFTAGASTVKFTGNTDTTVAYMGGNSYTKFNNLTLDKTAYGIAIKSGSGVKNVLTVSAGYLYPDSNLTLLSDAANTARLAVVPSGANIYGKAMVERYIPSKRAWRLMTAPVTDASTIYRSWQNNGVYTVGKGILVSTPGGGPGLDNGNIASLKTWDVTNQVLKSVTNTLVSASATNTGSADNTGYFVFVRGDRNPNNFIVPNTNITTMTSIGRLQVGTQTFTASAKANGYTLIGNPFAAPIDFNSVTRINLLKRFYVWDPTLNTLGGYVTLDDLNNDGIYTKSVSISSQTKEIQSSQAFFVQTNINGAASITIGESAKSTTNNTPVFRPLGTGSVTGQTSLFSTNLFLLNTDSTEVLADGVLVEFGSDYHDDVTNEDAVKFNNTNENIAVVRYGSALSIERRPEITGNDTIFYKLWRTTAREYLLKLIPENIYKPGLRAFFEDSYLNTRVPVSLTDTSIIRFAIDASTASAAENRFRVVFNPMNVLPVSFSMIKAFQVDGEVSVNWKVQDETNIISYKVQKSANGIDFKDVNTTEKNASGNYSKIDDAPFTGKNFYRVKSIDRDGSVKYSAVAVVMIENKTPGFAVVPNPVKGNNIRLQFASMAKGKYQFNVLNSGGQVVFSSNSEIGAGSTSKVLPTQSALAAGIYQLQISGPDNYTATKKIIIQD